MPPFGEERLFPASNKPQIMKYPSQRPILQPLHNRLGLSRPFPLSSASRSHHFETFLPHKINPLQTFPVRNPKIVWYLSNRRGNHPCRQPKPQNRNRTPPAPAPRRVNSAPP